MAQYVLAYHPSPSKPMTPEEGADSFTRWQQWLADLGDAVVTPDTALSGNVTVSAEGVTQGGGPNPLMGFTIIQAESLDAALEMAQRCPFLEMGTIEVGQVHHP